MLEDFKKLAREYQKNNKICYSKALNAIALQRGYKNYNAYLASIKTADKSVNTVNKNSTEEFLSILMNSERIEPNTPMKGEMLSKNVLEEFKKEYSTPLDAKKVDDFIKSHLGEFEVSIEKVSNKIYKIEEEKSLEDIKNEILETYEIINKIKPIKEYNSPIFIRAPEGWTSKEKTRYYNLMKYFYKNKIKNNIDAKTIINYWLIQKECEKISPSNSICGCMGPRNGEPLCPCAMKHVVQIHNENGKWFDIREFENKISIIPAVKNASYIDTIKYSHIIN